jgi:hypothetical protein
VLLDCVEDAALLQEAAFPQTPCPACATVSHFDDDARSYLAFGPTPRVPPPEVARALSGLGEMGQVDPVEKFIDGRVNRVRINARLDEALRWPRVFDGLEGDVVLELASSPGSTPAGIAGLAAALRRLPEEVDSLRLEGTPAALLEVLATAKRDPRMLVGTALVEGYCGPCATARPVQLRVEEATEALREGREPYAVCKRCNATLSFERLHGLLERMAGEESRRIPMPNVAPAAPPAVEAAAPVASLPPPPGMNPAVAVALGVGVVNAALLGVLLWRGPLAAPQPPPPAPPPAPVVVAPPPAEPAVELPPGWADAQLMNEGDTVFLVGRAKEAPSEEAALGQARSEAQLVLVKALQAKLAGTPLGGYLAAHPQGALEGNMAPIVTRFEKQLGEAVAPVRTDAALKRKEAKVSGPVRYRLGKEAFERAIAFYGASGEGMSLTVGRFFPSLEASTRTDAELVVLAAADGPAREAGVAEGDLVVAVDGAPVSSPEAFTAAVEARPAGTLTLTLESAGTRRDVQVKVPRKAPGR